MEIISVEHLKKYYGICVRIEKDMERIVVTACL